EAFLLKQTFAVRGLLAHAAAVRDELTAGDIAEARSAAGRMVSRDTSSLDPAATASAAIESLSENASDSAVAPWLWYAAAGPPAAPASTSTAPPSSTPPAPPPPPPASTAPSTSSAPPSPSPPPQPSPRSGSSNRNRNRRPNRNRGRKGAEHDSPATVIVSHGA